MPAVDERMAKALEALLRVSRFTVAVRGAVGSELRLLAREGEMDRVVMHAFARALFDAQKEAGVTSTATVLVGASMSGAGERDGDHLSWRAWRCDLRFDAKTPDTARARTQVVDALAWAGRKRGIGRDRTEGCGRFEVVS